VKICYPQQLGGNADPGDGECCPAAAGTEFAAGLPDPSVSSAGPVSPLGSSAVSVYKMIPD